jgi:CBS domain containing-hemolysin-like protein
LGFGCFRKLAKGSNVSIDNDDSDRALEDEHPGPDDLESALISASLTDVAKKTPLIVESNTTLATVLQTMQRDDRGAALVVELGSWSEFSLSATS